MEIVLGIGLVLGFIVGFVCAMIYAQLAAQTAELRAMQTKKSDPSEWWKEGGNPYDDDDL